MVVPCQKTRRQAPPFPSPINSKRPTPCVAAGAARAEAVALANAIAAKSRAGIQLGKRAFYQQIEMPLAEAYRYTSEVMVENMLEADAKEGIGAFIDKRDPKFDDN